MSQGGATPYHTTPQYPTPQHLTRYSTTLVIFAPSALSR